MNSISIFISNTFGSHTLTKKLPQCDLGFLYEIMEYTTTDKTTLKFGYSSYFWFSICLSFSILYHEILSSYLELENSINDDIIILVWAILTISRPLGKNF